MSEIKANDKEQRKLLKKQKREEAKMKKEALKLEKKPKPSTMKNWVKEIKRIIWPKSSKAWRWFGITIAFLLIMGLFCFLITLGFTSMWNAVGIKV